MARVFLTLTVEGNGQNSNFISLYFCLSAEGTDSIRLTEIYSHLEEIEADKAPARY